MDTLIRGVMDTHAGPAKRPQVPAPMVELMSQYPGGGKTHMLYHLTALAVLPTSLGGRQAAVLYFDTDKHFSVPRLAQQIQRLALAHGGEPFNKTETKNMIRECLKHVHIFKPSSLANTVHTLNNIAKYLFNPLRHHSFDRAIAFIAIDSASAFYWQARLESDQANLASFTIASKKSAAEEHSPPPPPIGYNDLASALKSASRTLSTPVIYTARDYSPTQLSRQQVQQHQSSAFSSHLNAFSYRPCLPSPFHSLPTLRFVIRRADVRKLPAGISFEEAARENAIRKKVVALGKFECFVNEWGVDEKVMEKLRARGAMFEVFITGEGVKIGDGPE